MQHMQDVLLPFFSNNIFCSFCNAGNIKPGFKAIKQSKEKIAYFIAIILRYFTIYSSFIL